MPFHPWGCSQGSRAGPGRTQLLLLGMEPDHPQREKWRVWGAQPSTGRPTLVTQICEQNHFHLNSISENTSIPNFFFI